MEIPLASQIKYLVRRHEELGMAKQALSAGDLSPIQSMGHKLKGNGATFGFPELGELGAELESAAAEHRVERISSLMAKFEQWLETHPIPN
jgi:HPt (histidine-containing phosphotransfer) domain-containing protein